MDVVVSFAAIDRNRCLAAATLCDLIVDLSDDE
jgi:hypothetical protein